MVVKSEKFTQKMTQRQSIESTTQKSEIFYCIKRGIDIFISLSALLVLSPLLLLVALLIKLDSPGPVIFTQRRITTRRNKVNGTYQWERTVFQFYKFRTMYQNADSTIHQAYVKALINHDDQTISNLNKPDEKMKKLTNDPRITRLGRFLRRASIDEIPQFWNVIRGEMSVVGPRPAIPYEVDLYKPWYFRRFEAKPGLTGLWQVIARCSVDFDGMVRLDIEYIEKQSLLKDLKIILMTPRAILRRRGAA